MFFFIQARILRTVAKLPSPFSPAAAFLSVGLLGSTAKNGPKNAFASAGGGLEAALASSFLKLYGSVVTLIVSGKGLVPWGTTDSVSLMSPLISRWLFTPSIS